MAMLPPNRPPYARIDLGDPTYRHVKNLIDKGLWACDSIDHNESTGCSNPDCFKYTSEDSLFRRPLVHQKIQRSNQDFYLERAQKHGDIAVYYKGEIANEATAEFPMPEWNDQHFCLEAMEAWHYAQLLTDAQLMFGRATMASEEAEALQSELDVL